MKKVKSYIKDIKNAGFGYLKVELEAELGRGDDDYDDERESCDDCSTDGYVDCAECDGSGVIDEAAYSQSGRDLGTTVEVECPACDGDGNVSCSTCDGEGYIESESSDYGDVSTCEEFILDNVSREARNCLNFSRFYNDGSVDSEFTFTLPVEKAHLLPEYINAFSKLADEIGNGIDIDGAGMHIAVLAQESMGRYPTGIELDSSKVRNFKREVTKLLPALFIAACSGNFTRSFEYRPPQVEQDKYSAINIFRGGFEYRLFETCYQRPEAIFEYLGTIARTLEYYKDSSKKIEVQGKQYNFYNQSGLDGFMSTPEQVRIIKRQLKFVTPKNMTLKELQINRDINISVTNVSKGYSKKVTRAKAMFKEHLKDAERRLKAPLSAAETRRLQDMESYYDFPANATHDEKVMALRGIRKIQNEEQFINNNVTGMQVAASVAV